MKTALMSISLVLVFSCQPQEQQKPNVTEPGMDQATQQIQEITDSHFETFVIEDCEYLIYKSLHGGQQGFGMMTHKGNCKNPIHCYNMP